MKFLDKKAKIFRKGKPLEIYRLRSALTLAVLCLFFLSSNSYISQEKQLEIYGGNDLRREIVRNLFTLVAPTSWMWNRASKFKKWMLLFTSSSHVQFLFFDSSVSKGSYKLQILCHRWMHFFSNFLVHFRRRLVFCWTQKVDSQEVSSIIEAWRAIHSLKSSCCSQIWP